MVRPLAVSRLTAHHAVKSGPSGVTGASEWIASGRTLGEAEKIGVAQALRTITLGAAYTLKLDGEIGSIECGKRADFAVLEDDPMEIGPQKLKDVRIWGTVQDGRVFESAPAPREAAPAP